MTEATTDDLIEAANGTGEPWFIWAAYQSAHAPIHAPPPHLNPKGITQEHSQLERWHAMIEAMDLELGRALREIDPEVLANTVVVFIGDNGSIARFMPEGWEPSGGKGFVAESGIRVPMVVAGPGVRIGRTEVLVHVTDLLPTFAAIAGIKPVGGTTVGQWEQTEPTGVFDGASFEAVLSDPEARGARRYIYAESFEPLGPGPYGIDNQSLRDERYKFVSFRGEQTFHDLRGRHDDGPALTTLTPDQEHARARLKSIMLRHQDLR